MIDVARLAVYMSSQAAVKSLLQWVISGLDELDQEAALADSISFDYAVTSPDFYPSYRGSETLATPPTVPGPGPDSPPLEPAKIVEDDEEGQGEGGLGVVLGQGLAKQEGGDEDAQRQKYAAASLRRYY
jgi:hypothetical protein